MNAFDTHIAEDLTTSLSIFGTEYTVGQNTVTAIYETEYEVFCEGEGPGYSSTRQVLIMATSDMENLSYADEVAINNVVKSIDEIQHLGGGLSLAILKRHSSQSVAVNPDGSTMYNPDGSIAVNPA